MQAVQEHEAPDERPEAEAPEVVVKAIRSGVLADVWPHIEPLVAKAVAEGHGEEHVADVLERLAHRDYQMWLVLRDNRVAAVLVTTVVSTPRQKACRVVYCAGEEMEAWWQAAQEVVETWARQLGCDVMQMHGRAGWSRLMKKLGAKRVSTVYQKELA